MDKGAFWDALRIHGVLMEEVNTEIRKGIPQGKFVVMFPKVEDGEYWDHETNEFMPIPEGWYGLWITSVQFNLNTVDWYDPLYIDADDWVRAKEITITSYEEA